MQVPDYMRKCVAFVGYPTKGGFALAGTVFFVGIRISETLFATYAVTARHVIEELTKRSIDPINVHFRVNLKAGGSAVAPISLGEWSYHSTENCDVAVTSVSIADELDHKFLDVETFATQDVISKEAISLGDELFLVGLFSKHSGNARNIPILRVANIAAMPEEKVQTSMGNMDAYLIEARSIGGISGSPVFVHLNGVRKVGNEHRVIADSKFYLLGLMHGHWDVPATTQELPGPDALGAEKINTGIAVVIPAQKISDILMQPDFVSARERMHR